MTIRVGEQRTEQEPNGLDRVVEEAREERLARRVRGVGDDGQAAAGYGALHHRDLEALAETRDQRREVGDERVVVERGQQRRAQEERRLRQAGEHRRDPPALQPAVDHEPGQEEPHEQRRLQVDLALIGGRGPGEPEEDQETADEERGIVRRQDRPRHEGHVCGA